MRAADVDPGLYADIGVSLEKGDAVFVLDRQPDPKDPTQVVVIWGWTSKQSYPAQSLNYVRTWIVSRCASGSTFFGRQWQCHAKLGGATGE